MQKALAFVQGFLRCSGVITGCYRVFCRLYVINAGGGVKPCPLYDQFKVFGDSGFIEYFFSINVHFFRIPFGIVPVLWDIHLAGF